MVQIKIMITIWPVLQFCVVWKHVFLRRPQRDNYCQLNYSACSPCVFWLRASDPLTPEQRHETGPPASLLSPLLTHPTARPPATPPPPLNINHGGGIQIYALQLSKMQTRSARAVCHPLWQKHHAGSCMGVSFDFFV